MNDFEIFDCYQWNIQDYIIYKSKKLDHEIEEDREEGISGPVLDSIGELLLFALFDIDIMIT